MISNHMTEIEKMVWAAAWHSHWVRTGQRGLGLDAKQAADNAIADLRQAGTPDKAVMRGVPAT